MRVKESDVEGISKIREFIEEQSGIGLLTSAKLLNFELINLNNAGSECNWNANLKIDSLFLKDYDRVLSGIWFYSLGNMLSFPDTLSKKLDFTVNNSIMNK